MATKSLTVGSRGKYERRPLSKRQLEVLTMLMETDLSIADVAEKFGMSRTTIYTLLDRDDVMEMQRKVTEKALRGAAIKAARVLVKQLDDPNAWLAQNAARAILQQVPLTEKQVEDNGITVNFVTMPEPSMPKPEVDEPPVASSDAEVT